MGIVYVLTNEAMPGVIKIGRTNGDLGDRLRSLSGHSGVPVAFECYYAGEIEDPKAVEQAIHAAFDDFRLNPKREFFTLDPFKAKVILQQIAVADVTPKESPADSEEEQEAIEKLSERRPPFRFSDAAVPKGATLVSSRLETETAEVVDERTIRFRGKETSLSAAALSILHELGYKQRAVQGPAEWLYEGETLSSRRVARESY